MSWKQWMMEEQAKEHPENAIYVNGQLICVGDKPFTGDFLMINGQKVYVDKPITTRIWRFFTSIWGYLTNLSSDDSTSETDTLV